ncbi:MAG: hypothetical protein J6X07_03195 [Prevotella sp.]|nr:hypothetical protein [Prevotella sp.]
MKTIRLFGVALLTVLMSVCFSACSSSDDDDNGGGGSEVTASIEGTWYLKSENWGGETKTYEDYSDKRIWVITKSGSNLILNEKKTSDSGKEYTLETVGNNEYKKGNDKFVIKTLTSKMMEVGYYDNFYIDDESSKESGIYTFMR